MPALSGLPTEAQSPTLSSVRKIYIQKMDNGLDPYLAAAISKKFHGTVLVVLSARDADAVLKGLNTAAQNTRESNVQLVDRRGKDLKHGGRQQVADKLIGQLKKAMEP